jgi:5-enolpyruvylshikimate-3-phosphate synthase
MTVRGLAEMSLSMAERGWRARGQQSEKISNSTNNHSKKRSWKRLLSAKSTCMGQAGVALRLKIGVAALIDEQQGRVLQKRRQSLHERAGPLEIVFQS